MLLMVSILPFGTPVLADYQAGVDAAKSGDYTTALKEWKPLAVQGDADAQYNLGQMYRQGKGVTQDYKAAAKWYRLAAEQGNAKAQFMLGWMYCQGHGITQDFIRAHMWWNIAASPGDEMAAEMRNIVAKEMTSADISKAQDLARECMVKNYKGC